MKRNIINGVMLVAALAFASCSTQKLATNQKSDDDVYYSKAEAGDAIDRPATYAQQDVYSDYTDDDDYYYYDSYASRINRFNYSSPFNYYDDFYYGYTPYYGYPSYYGYGMGLSPYYAGVGFGFGIGYDYGYPWGYGYGYSPYSYLGIGYGGGYPYWGIYSSYGYRGQARPYRGSGAPGLANRSVRGVGYSGAYPNAAYYPGRNINSTGRRITNGYPTNGSNNGYNGAQGRATRGARADYPTYQPQPRTVNSSPSYSGGSTSSGGSSGGGARPARP